MSQAKVDAYKKKKANRKQEMKREKMERTLAYGITGVIATAICVWIGVSAYSKVTGSTGESAAVSVNTNAIDNYLSELSSADE